MLHLIYVMCSVLRVSRNGYYAWVKRTPICREYKNGAPVVKIQDVFKKSEKRYCRTPVEKFNKSIYIAEENIVDNTMQTTAENNQS